MATADDPERIAPDPRWLAVHELRLEGLTYPQIGATLGLSPGYLGQLWRAGATPEQIEELRRARTPARRQRSPARHRRIIRAMQDWARLHGDPPSGSDWHRAHRIRSPRKLARYEATGRTWPSTTDVVKAFGTWNTAMRAAGFEPRPAKRRTTIS